MYTTTNFPSKKALKAAIAAGKQIGVYQPGIFGGNEPREGKVYIEGPWGVHKYYAEAWIEDGLIKRIK